MTKTPNRNSPITYRGQLFPSQRALALHLSVSEPTVSRAIRTGRVDRLGTGSPTGTELVELGRVARNQPCAALGWTWPSQLDAAIALGVTTAAVSKALNRGRFESMVRQRLGQKLGMAPSAGE